MIDQKRYLEQSIQLFAVYQCKVENIILLDSICVCPLKKYVYIPFFYFFFKILLKHTKMFL